MCSELPTEERYGIAAQLKRAAVSVPSNLAEGAARSCKKEFLQFLSIAQGSLAELDTQLELCQSHLALLERSNVDPLVEKVNRIVMMITGLRNSLRRNL